jgi:serine/threonine protein kinase
MNDPAGREIAGSLDYMAPEQRGGGNVDARADLYACGVVMYEMLTGEKPAGTDVPSDVNKAVPKVFDEIFRRSYARLEKRFASAEEFLQALPTAATTTMPPRPFRRPEAVGNQAAATRTVSCPRCNRPVDSGDQFCIHCGVQMVTTVRRCHKCGGYPDATDRYCIHCGEALTPELTTV